MTEPWSQQDVVRIRCSRKKRYHYGGLAERIAKKQSKKTGDWIMAYECVDCGGWHIGHAQADQIIVAQWEQEHKTRNKVTTRTKAYLSLSDYSDTVAFTPEELQELRTRAYTKLLAKRQHLIDVPDSPARAATENHISRYETLAAKLDARIERCNKSK